MAGICMASRRLGAFSCMALNISCSDVQYGFPHTSALERPKDTLATLDYGPWTIKIFRNHVYHRCPVSEYFRCF